MLGGHVEEAESLRALVETRLDSAEPPVVIAYERTAGRLDVPAGETDAGSQRLRSALGSAREHGLLYDECLCQRAIVAAAAEADAAGSPFPDGLVDAARADHDALARRLGLVRR